MADDAGPAIVTVDTETTGLGHANRPPRRDAVVQIGIAWRTPTGQMQSWHELCNPGDEFLAAGRAQEALRLNNLDAETVTAAPPVAAVAAGLREKLRGVREAVGAPVEIRSYNRDFDAPFLTMKPWGLDEGSWGPCVMKAAAEHLNGPGGRWPKLEEAVSRLGLEWPSGLAHHAGVDAQAALLVDEELRRHRVYDGAVFL